MSPSFDPPRDRTVVKRPRAADGLGTALRDVYGPDDGLPAEMTMLLAMLGDPSARNRR